MISHISKQITDYFSKSINIKLMFNHQTSNTYCTNMYDVYIDSTLLLPSLRICDMIVDFRKETNWSDNKICDEMVNILIGYISDAINSIPKNDDFNKVVCT